MGGSDSQGVGAAGAPPWQMRQGRCARWPGSPFLEMLAWLQAAPRLLGTQVLDVGQCRGPQWSWRREAWKASEEPEPYAKLR